MTIYENATSLDGTAISYTSEGEGLGLIVIPGNNRMAHNYDKISGLLAKSGFRVYVLERRGRGKSGSQGDNYSIDREIEDLQAVMDKTGATFVFGHSYGGLIALEAARIEPRIAKLSTYEPIVSINGSFDGTWISKFEHELKNDKPTKAMAIFFRKTDLTPFTRLPGPLLRLISLLLLSGKSGKEMHAMMPTTPKEVREVLRLDSTGEKYRSITALTLILNGSKSPNYLTNAFKTLEKYIPNVTYKVLNGFDHNAPDLSAREEIARELKVFYTTKVR